MVLGAVTAFEQVRLYLEQHFPPKRTSGFKEIQNGGRLVRSEVRSLFNKIRLSQLRLSIPEFLYLEQLRGGTSVVNC